MQDIVRVTQGDAFGTALMDCFHGTETHYVVEREDGFADPNALSPYFAAKKIFSPTTFTLLLRPTNPIAGRQRNFQRISHASPDQMTERR